MAAGSDSLGIVTSTADMFSGVDLSDFNAPDTPDTSGDTSSDDLGVPDAVEAEPVTDETPEVDPVEESPTEEADPATEEASADAAATQPELPDGVREVTDANGKKEMRVSPARWDTIYNKGYKMLRQFEEVAGEPMTPEAFDVRHRAFMGQEKLYTDLLSGEPESQAKVLNHFIDEAARAVQEGDLGTDPTVSLGTTMYEALQQRSPDGFAHLRMRAAGDLVSEMYAEAQRSGDKNLAMSASHIAKSLGLPYKRDKEISQFLATPPANADPAAAIRAENERLKQQLNEGQTRTAAEQFKSWKGETAKSVTSGVLNDAVLPSLSSERKAWDKFPTQFENLVVAPLNRAVKQTISQDRGFLDRIQLLETAATRAASAQRRADLAGQIKQAYVNRARLAVEAHKSGILREAAAVLKQGSDATHSRHQAAQGQKGPRGPQAPVQRSIIPDKNADAGGVFDPKAEYRRMMQLIG